ncbi:MAG TPA: STAS domain-containing protein [Herpetosiphonaceae bacterium]
MPFVAFWREHMDAFTDGLYHDVIRLLPTYARLPREDLIASIHSKARLWQELMETGDIGPTLERTRSVGQVRVTDHAPLIELVATSDLFRDHIWKLARQLYPPEAWPVDAMEQVQQWNRLDRNEVIATYSRVLQDAWAKLGERERELEQQRKVIQELSTPIVSIYEGIVLLPLVGHIDDRRAQEIIDSAMTRIVERQAEILILDITGVPKIDAAVAHELLKLAHAVKLIGAQTILVGISASIAQTVMQLGLDLHQLNMRADLADGIRHALACRGYAIHAVA